MQAETEGLRWRPTRELQGLPGAPETSDTPMLPIPFTARELAAFMLAGTGALVASFYGDWSDGPNPERLGDIDRDSFARRAVIDAFAAYRLAKEEVGEWESVWSQRETTRKASSREPNNTALLKAFDEAQATWDTAYQTWLNAMVIELLGVGVEIESSGPATGTQPQAGPAPGIQAVQDAPVVEAPAASKAKRRTWMDVCGPYFNLTLGRGQYTTGKKFYAALMATAGTEGSPFAKGTGDNRGSLFIVETKRPLPEKTITTNWRRIREGCKV